ncbi:hypothetical protein HDU98_009053 [Podochytrium sp. JEL0797]|nr:hypothetical protein HDU98_009053 [Podochytrium sp. JEL0797]
MLFNKVHPDIRTLQRPCTALAMRQRPAGAGSLRASISTLSEGSAAEELSAGSVSGENKRSAGSITGGNGHRAPLNNGLDSNQDLTSVSRSDSESFGVTMQEVESENASPFTSCKFHRVKKQRNLLQWFHAQFLLHEEKSPGTGIVASGGGDGVSSADHPTSSEPKLLRVVFYFEFEEKEVEKEEEKEEKDEFD